ncbi:hypothetical protein A2W45_03560 [Candidatus Curtissbacteria bacterium RIFCSPHIGHO2_12_41_11]|uniref:OBG-type G domain-containing protein n=3 Tax=Candidatus Curtissiibacteriota TaxID=1752717 RepID=A0A1F5HV11_9BACT|nr:MAG: GTP-binding protein [Candidatus Curtissbacteria bacterium GW2011_GWA2_41_24]OGD99094.1 MAG: hypothetical protein A2W45_03560 [Candidatus Curtissbacteria bacterium RIFCSPHIGHO2_12_41_11]OGE07829.1 MAG: hypothetical protein A2W70_02960 [Candidatus Curtissbacteria bacterium RIFCSPLOWO2_02_41_11]
MSLSIGIVGLPNSGKSTLFNAVLKRQIAQVAEYPYTTIEPNIGVVEVPDKRLSLLATSLSIQKIVPAAIRFIDIAGLVKGAHQGEGLGNQFLAHIREVDAILQVVRAFENSQVPHVAGKVDPREDIEIVNLELELAEIKKPTIYVLNMDEKSITESAGIKSIRELIFDKSKSKGLGQDGVVIPVCAKLEAELSDLSEEEQKAYLKEVGIEKSGLDQVISASYKLLDLITFFTIAGGKMVQAWPVKVGTKMIEAAEIVHSDFARGFITAEVCNFSKLVEAKSWHNAREKGWLHTAGRDEVVKDGEVVEFKFRV